MSSGCATVSSERGSSAIRHVIIVGGGTAGWLTAGVLAADHRANQPDGLQISLIESPNIPIIGVGEGTWPSLRDTLRRIGLSETDLIRHCNASFKQGSRFDGWKYDNGDDFYFHPFDAPPSSDEIDWQALWLTAQQMESGDGSASGDGESLSFGAAMSPQIALCLQGKAPKQITTPEYAAVTNYAYHFDAPAFAALLRKHCTTHLGVRLIEDDVTDVRLQSDNSADSGDSPHIEALQTREHGEITGDFFVDCSGMQALLIGKALGAEVTDVSDILFNDSALAVQVPYPQADSPIASQTTGTAGNAGWIWDIGLQTRRGVGYVFSSAHCEESQAREELSRYIERTSSAAGTDAGDLSVSGAEARLLRFRSGYLETPWVGNVLAIGMAQGFVEPLEASAIVMIELSATMLSDTLPTAPQGLPAAASRFNSRFAYRWARIVDFLKLHYLLSDRSQAYWRDHRRTDTASPRLNDLLEQWQWQPPSREDFPQALEIFPAASYAFVLYGMGFAPAPRPHYRRKDMPQRAAHYRQDILARQGKFLGGLPSNRELINHIHTHGLSRR